jgi:hypothetical protein
MPTRTNAGAGDSLPPSDLAEALRALETLGIDELRAAWRRVHRTPAPRCFNRELLLRDAAYELQSAALGRLRSDSRRRLLTLARGDSKPNEKVPRALSLLKPGTTLVRQWHGRTHTVVVHEEGFEHLGRRYASLTEIAHAITGAHWSGPRFFGLKHRPRTAEAPSASAKGTYA